jgi:hypothetical protein
MDAKMIEMNNLRALNDYLNQTIEVLVRSPRTTGTAGFGYSPFGGTLPTGQSGIGTDFYGHVPFFGGSMLPHPAFAAQNPFTGLPVYGASYGAVDPFLAQRGLGQSPFGQTAYGQSPFGTWQASWAPMAEAARQAQVAQALAAKGSVLEAICRSCGIPV